MCVCAPEARLQVADKEDWLVREVLRLRNEVDTLKAQTAVRDAVERKEQQQQQQQRSVATASFALEELSARRSRTLSEVGLRNRGSDWSTLLK